MENELTIGSIGISVLLTVILRLVFGTINIPKRLRPWIAILAGIALSLTALWIRELAEITKLIIAAHVVQGFMVGATAIGINELASKPRPGSG